MNTNEATLDNLQEKLSLLQDEYHTLFESIDANIIFDENANKAVARQLRDIQLEIDTVQAAIDNFTRQEEENRRKEIEARQKKETERKKLIRETATKKLPEAKARLQEAAKEYLQLVKDIGETPPAMIDLNKVIEKGKLLREMG